MGMQIDSSKCTGCGACISACNINAITLQDNLAVIDGTLCVECGKCAEVCPSGAIHGAVPALNTMTKGGERMYGYGRGFGFRGSSPTWPYVGRGRGGMPRCWYPGLYGGRTAYAAPVIDRQQELDYLKNQAQAFRSQLEEIESRIQQLTNKAK
jgi:NAD-dependent dihydropyrimidine dehydrogenase PreA subunit